MLSNKEENFLKSIYVLNQEQGSLASTSALASHLNINASLVSEMLKKLKEKDLVLYEKYQAVKLSPKGTKKALEIVRKQRLWECFLVKKLNFKWNEVDEIAEQLEHIHSKTLTNKLDEFLGHPSIDPHGDPIPDDEGNFKVKLHRTLAQQTNPSQFSIQALKEKSHDFLELAENLKLVPGNKLELFKINPFDQSVEVQIEGL